MKAPSFATLSLLVGTSLAAAGAAEVESSISKRCVNYFPPSSTVQKCCDEAANTLFWINRTLQIGVCCALGSILDGLDCVPAPPPPPPPPGQNGTTPSICSGEPVCPQQSGRDLGIAYGHCYVLRSLSGLYLGHDYATKYEVMGENPGVVFRVCAAQGDCTSRGGERVPANGTWYLQDQFGDPSGSGFGWLGGSGDLSVQADPASALPVAGSSNCYGGKCAVCIRFPPGGAHAPCPLSPGQSHLGVAANPNSCQPFYWEEVGCRSEQ
ncbi:hypothetical protein C8A03DRAFT_15063 [Achaetomium macrosporum]|uniref:Uncharacterized protein n=1 Tax=Achaetomium macrosporum TaxID=79813 RepID=A0AAN7CBH6_9PEZI|nr:hypothetical protein C8A03DRAFT_15063 [Achaetomium macrosporum]